MSTTNTSPIEYFNLHVSGIGYLNRVRWVEPSRSAGRRAQKFLACSISALRGRPEDREYTYFDVRVSGTEAQELIEGLMGDVGDRRKVVIGFRIGDIYSHTYEREVRDPQSGQKTGEREAASLIKGRLLLINSITIDGERVFTRPSADEGAVGASNGDVGHDVEDQGQDDVPDRQSYEPSTGVELEDEPRASERRAPPRPAAASRYRVPA